MTKDISLPDLPDDEKPHAEECQKLYRKLKPGMLKALFLFCRYQDSYNSYKSVRNYFSRLVELGLADTTQQPTGKGKCLYRIIVCDAINDVNEQVEANTRRNRKRNEIVPPAESLPPLIEHAVTEYNRVYLALEKLEKETGTQSPEYGKLYEQKRAIESMFGTYRYMLDWNQKTKQFTVYLDK